MAAEEAARSANASENSTPIPSPPPASSQDAYAVEHPSSSGSIASSTSKAPSKVVYKMKEYQIRKVSQNTKEGADEEDVVQVNPPTNMELQMLIDQTASWAVRQTIKNSGGSSSCAAGTEDKLAVLKKLHKDQFDFLFSSGTYHTYYQYKLALYTEMLVHQKQQQNEKRELEDNSDATARYLRIDNYA